MRYICLCEAIDRVIYFFERENRDRKFIDEVVRNCECESKEVSSFKVDVL